MSENLELDIAENTPHGLGPSEPYFRLSNQYSPKRLSQPRKLPECTNTTQY